MGSRCTAKFASASFSVASACLAECQREQSLLAQMHALATLRFEAQQLLKLLERHAACLGSLLTLCAIARRTSTPTEGRGSSNSASASLALPLAIRTSLKEQRMNSSFGASASAVRQWRSAAIRSPRRLAKSASEPSAHA